MLHGGPVLEAHRPCVAWRGGANIMEDANPVSSASARHAAPAAAVIVQGKGFLLSTVVVIARGPDVIGAYGRDVGQYVLSGADGGHDSLRPRRAIVMQDERSEP